MKVERGMVFRIEIEMSNGVFGSEGVGDTEMVGSLILWMMPFMDAAVS